MLMLGVLAADALALKLDVKVEGLEGEQEANVLALLAIYQDREEKAMTVPRLLSLHREAPEQIRDALAPFGHYRVEVKEDLTEPSDPEGTWVASYKVTPGPPVRIASVDYQVTGPGADDPAFPKPDAFPIKKGDVLIHSVYEQAKSELRYAATSQGYLNYDLVRHQVLVDPVAYDARVYLHLETGPRYYLGDVTFKQDLLADSFIRRYLNFEPGDVYDPDVLVGLQTRLLASEYFGDVEVIPRKDTEGGSTTVPIEIVAVRNKANKYRIGVGYSTNLGPRVSMDWKRRYLNRWGHKFRSQLSLAPALSELYLDYRIPIKDPLRDYISIKPNVSYYDDSTKKGWNATLQFARSTVTPGNWRRTIGIDFSHEDYEINNDDAQQADELVPYITWSKTRADDPIYTRHGHRIKYGIYGSSTALFSPTNYLSAAIDFKMIRSFWQDYRLILRTELGATLANSVDDLPASRRFYTGGDNTIRGWGYDALGPKDPITNETVGGRYLAVGSIELERQIVGPWSAAVFTDFGNAFDPDYEQVFEQSVGTGLRWRSPIGQIRLDVAFALTKPEDTGRFGLPPARLHFVIGPDL